MSSNENITAIFILEVIGKPAEYLKDTLKNLIEKMKQEKGVTVKNQKINEPVLMKDKKDFYTTFAEIELETEDLLKLMRMVFGYMPAHIEIISPENLKLTNDGLSGILNELTRRLHGYDELARIMQIERKILEKKFGPLLKKEFEKKQAREKEKKE